MEELCLIILMRECERIKYLKEIIDVDAFDELSIGATIENIGKKPHQYSKKSGMTPAMSGLVLQQRQRNFERTRK